MRHSKRLEFITDFGFYYPGTIQDIEHGLMLIAAKFTGLYGLL
jgi:hypothetical protein